MPSGRVRELNCFARLKPNSYQGLLPHNTDDRNNVPASLLCACRGEATKLGTVLWKLQAVAYVEEDVIGFWLEMLPVPEAVMLRDTSQESIPLSLVFGSVAQWRS